MKISIPTPASPRKARIGWCIGGGVGIAVGLYLASFPVFQIGSWVEFALAFVPAFPGVLFVVTGLRVILRVSGIWPDSRIKALSVLSFALAATMCSIGTVGSLFTYAVARSALEHEGGTADASPMVLLVAAATLAVLTLAFFFLASFATRIEDGPGAIDSN